MNSAARCVGDRHFEHAVFSTIPILCRKAGSVFDDFDVGVVLELLALAVALYLDLIADLHLLEVCLREVDEHVLDAYRVCR
jgi:hypothetical protein